MLQESAEDLPLQIYPINTLDRITEGALPWACVGQLLPQAVAALPDPLQIAQQRSSIDQKSLWMAKLSPWESPPPCPLSTQWCVTRVPAFGLFQTDVIHVMKINVYIWW